MSVKEAPSALSLRGIGQRSANCVPGLNHLLRMGFPLEGVKLGVWENISYTREDQVTVIESELGTVLSREHHRTAPEPSEQSYVAEGSERGYAGGDDPNDSWDSEIDPNLAQSILDEYTTVRVRSSDFFKTMKTLRVAEILGREQPKVLEWNADLIRLQDPLPAHILRPGGYEGKREIYFSQIKDPGLREYVVENHTYWGSCLQKLCKDGSTLKGVFALTLRRRLRSFLRGGPDVAVKAHHRELLQSDQTPKDSQRRCERLIECLKTVDGMFYQRFLIDPTENWTWDRYDMFILGNLDVLITDEFLDGEPTEFALNLTTAYGALKSDRKMLKKLGHLHDLDSFSPSQQWLGQLAETIKLMPTEGSPEYTRALGILSQTRGAGTPPPIVVLRSKIQFLETVSVKPAPLTETVKGLLDVSIDRIISSVPDEALTGLATAARIKVTSSACYEYTVKEGGTAEAINDLVYLGEAGRPVQILDLATGKLLERKTLADMTVGEYIFWRSLEEVLSTPLDELTRLKLVMVSEPGKARTVSKGAACLKIVLDVVNKMVAKPFAKAFPSSASGMEKSNHGWNVYKEFFTGPLSDMVFSLHSDERTKVDEHTTDVEIVWETVYGSSTDFHTATDFANQEMGWKCARAMMLKVGIPKLLMGIVKAACFSPRTIEFAASGALRRYGTPLPDGRNVLVVERGVMMGDPLTKIVLHMINMGVRQLVASLVQGLPPGTARSAEIAEVIAAGADYI
jgi:hypothetical protein